MISLLLRLLGASVAERGPRATFFVAGPLLLRFMRGRAAAITIGACVLFATREELSSVTIRRHELVHVRQYVERGMVPFLAEYARDYLAARHAGLDHFEACHTVGLELEAYSAQEHEALPSDP